MATSATSQLARFVSKQIEKHQHRLTQREIAHRAGFKNANILSMIKDGRVKMPLERVPALAAALECDVTELGLLALRQHYSDDLVTLILSLGGQRNPVSADELVASQQAVTLRLHSGIKQLDAVRHEVESALEGCTKLENTLQEVYIEAQRLLDEAQKGMRS